MSKRGNSENELCALSDLSNEASVEQFFLARLFDHLGYRDSQIKPKASLSTLKVNLGRRKLNYRPDYAFEVRKKIRWVCEAKATTESLDEWVDQCSSYCLLLNQNYAANDPVQFFMLSNGRETRLYQWNYHDALLTLRFEDFVEGNEKYEQLVALVGQRCFGSPSGGDVLAPNEKLTLSRRSISEINVDFAWCHRHIWRKENLSYSAAFMEFVKIVFLKLISDQGVHERYGPVGDDGTISAPLATVKFSRFWINTREQDAPNPLDSIQFRHLLDEFELEIADGKKKRIFARNQRIDLSPETIKAIVARLEAVDLYSIDADLNGRLFETFLNATLRGKDLGQYFTPRSVVKLATRLARIDVTPQHVDLVLDACCGTGGFLIEALAEMWKKVDNNRSLSKNQKQELRQMIATQRIYGVDVAREPALARIARINMYLHGDGGSSIFQLDALDKRFGAAPTDDPEIAREKTELRGLIPSSTGFADVVLTNPPFAKEYSRSHRTEEELLDDYDLAFATRDSQPFREWQTPSAKHSEHHMRDLAHQLRDVLPNISEVLCTATIRARSVIHRRYLQVRCWPAPGPVPAGAGGTSMPLHHLRHSNRARVTSHSSHDARRVVGGILCSASPIGPQRARSPDAPTGDPDRANGGHRTTARPAVGPTTGSSVRIATQRREAHPGCQEQ